MKSWNRSFFCILVLFPTSSSPLQKKLVSSMQSSDLTNTKSRGLLISTWMMGDSVPWLGRLIALNTSHFLIPRRVPFDDMWLLLWFSLFCETEIKFHTHTHTHTHTQTQKFFSACAPSLALLPLSLENIWAGCWRRLKEESWVCLTVLAKAPETLRAV
jgi:hypothetical protein